MKIAYLTSQYPAVSHTFITREVLALRARGVTIDTFSIRRASAADTIDEQARAEARGTRWVLPARLRDLITTCLWLATSRPLLTITTLARTLSRPGMGVTARLKWVAYFAEAMVLAHWLTDGQYDRLHCHFGNSGSSTGMIAARLAGIPFSFTCHGSEVLEPVKFRLADKVAVADFVVCVSKFGMAQLMLLCPPNQWTKFHVVRCGLPAMPAPCGPNRSGHNEILCVGRLSPEKAHLVLLDALARLREHRVDFRCTLVGNGPMRSVVERRIRDLHLTERIRLTGSLPPAQVMACYRSATVAVLPSFTEGVPVTLMEALAHELPVVATYVGGVPELVDPGRSGLLVPPGDVEGLANALEHVLKDPDWARGLGLNGSQVVRRQFDQDTQAEALVRLFGCSSRKVGWSHGISSAGSTP
jgi:colanic acid/amylovoran biosynthesis glycosyltransferase